MSILSPKKICFIFGTRPEAIKMAPLILELQKRNEFNVEVCLTGQHKEMLTGVLEDFEIKETVNLELMKENQTLVGFASIALPAIDTFLQKSKPDIVFVHGDTSTALYGALAAFYNKIKIGHIEAGLRTSDKYSPFPEEMNRTLVGKLADYHFAPTKLSAENLLKENIDERRIFVTGNTVIDALLWMAAKQKRKNIQLQNVPPSITDSKSKLILITMHRRENFGSGLIQICEAIANLAQQHKDCLFVYPVHPNPNVTDNVHKVLSGIENVILIKPLGYSDFVYMMDRSYIILTDSGGVQEEAPGLGKPVLVLRENTERPEALSAGTVKLLGTNKELIIDTVNGLLNNPDEYKKMSEAVNPYGDGTACKKIVEVLLKQLNG